MQNMRLKIDSTNPKPLRMQFRRACRPSYTTISTTVDEERDVS